MYEYYHDRLNEVLAKDPTLTELLETAMSEGWSDWLTNLKLSAITTSGKGAKAPRKTGSRMTQDQVTEMRTKITTFLKGRAGSKVADVAAGVGGEISKVSAQLKKLATEGVVKTEGAKAKTTYCLK